MSQTPEELERRVDELARTVADLEGANEGRDLTIKAQRTELEDWKRRAFEGLKLVGELQPHVLNWPKGAKERIAALRADFPVPF